MKHKDTPLVARIREWQQLVRRHSILLVSGISVNECVAYGFGSRWKAAFWIGRYLWFCAIEVLSESREVHLFDLDARYPLKQPQDVGHNSEGPNEHFEGNVTNCKDGVRIGCEVVVALARWSWEEGTGHSPERSLSLRRRRHTFISVPHAFACNLSRCRRPNPVVTHDCHVSP